MSNKGSVLEGLNGPKRIVWITVLLACSVAWQAAVGCLFAPAGGRLLGDSTEYLHLAVHLMEGKGLAYDPDFLTIENDAERIGWIAANRGRGLLRFEQDPSLYLRASQEGEVRPTNMRQPLYPLFLSLLFRSVGFCPAAIFFAQALLLSICYFLLFRIGRILFPQLPWAAPVGVALVVLFVPLAVLSSLVMSDILRIYFVTVGFYILVASTHVWRFALSGFVFGLGCLTSPLALPFAVCLVLLATAGRGLRRKFAVLPFLIALCLPLGLWTGRNGIVLGHPTPMSGESGINIWGGTLEPLNPLVIVRQQRPEGAIKTLIGDEYHITLRASKIFSRAALRRSSRQPLYSLVQRLSRLIRVGLLDFPCGRSLLGQKSETLYRIGQVCWACLWAAFLYAMLSLPRNLPWSGMLWAIPIWVFGLTFIASVSPRAFLSFYVFLFLGAGATLSAALGATSVRFRR